MSKYPTQCRPVVQIGPVCDDPTESVSSVNKAFIEGLSDNCRFVTPSANRKYGTTRQARLNLWNVYYLLKHTLVWLWSIIRYRPAVIHYGIASGWALEKALLFLWLARICGARTVGHFHSGDFVSFWDGLSERRRNRAARELARLDALVVLSEYWRQVVAERINISSERIHVVSNPINAAFEAEALQLPIQTEGRTILGLGVMGRDKGVFDAVEAAAFVRRHRPGFQIILAGPEREPGILEELKQSIQSASLGDHVHLHPAVWGNAKLDLFKQSRIMILPSYFENFPLVILEAAAAGHAIITTPVGAVPEFFTDGVSALFVQPGDPEQLAKAIIRLLNNPEERCRLAAAARDVFCRRLRKARIMADMDHVYGVILDPGSAARSDRTSWARENEFPVDLPPRRPESASIS
jgi:glycosyltransferase involved in cell wall biosynthesis